MTFSKKQGYAPEITIREDAPIHIRTSILEIAVEVGLSIEQMQLVVRKTLRPAYNQDIATLLPAHQAAVHLGTTSWFEFYDVVEGVYCWLRENPTPTEVMWLAYNYSTPPNGRYRWDEYQFEVNELFQKKGVGWQLVRGELESRGTEAFEAAIKEATSALSGARMQTAASELHKALKALSIRPEPDTTGAVTHAVAALECTLRSVTKNEKDTLGALLAKHKNRFAAPLNQAIEKLWGFASEYGRHVREGRVPKFHDAVLVVQIAAAASQYLVAATEAVV
jgi:hypothetical protein